MRNAKIIKKKKFDKKIRSESFYKLLIGNFIWKCTRRHNISLGKVHLYAMLFEFFFCAFLCVCYINENEVPQVFHILLRYVTQLLCCIWEKWKKGKSTTEKIWSFKTKFCHIFIQYFFSLFRNIHLCRFALNCVRGNWHYVAKALVFIYERLMTFGVICMIAEINCIFFFVCFVLWVFTQIYVCMYTYNSFISNIEMKNMSRTDAVRNDNCLYSNGHVGRILFNKNDNTSDKRTYIYHIGLDIGN